MKNEFDKYQGFVVYSQDNQPIGIVSSSGEKFAKCNINFTPKKFEMFLTSIEDRRFYNHSGIDIKSITRALYENVKARKIVQGASTITQQLARNLLQDKRVSIDRKLKEIFYALKIESEYTKKEVLELYYNNVFFGKNIYGLRTASLEYFSKEPEKLSTSEQILLITLLRGPNYYLNHLDKLQNRYNFLNNSLHNKKTISSRKFNKAKKTKLRIGQKNLKIYKNDSIPFIASTINHNNYTITSSINKEIQKEIIKYISGCNYPTNLICIKEGKVIGIGSSFGTDYPFIYRANVGSTRKPFIYTFLRANGFRKDDLFPTSTNENVPWNIREVQTIKENFLSLEEALKSSNNNVFVNASYQLGIEKVQLFLANLFNSPVEKFVPASVLGAVINGISLYELVMAYHNHFLKNSNNVINSECISILKEIANEKFNNRLSNIFIKTGTTNNNKERYGIVGMGKTLFGFLRQGNEFDDYSKDGNYISSILRFLRTIKNKIYKWD
jgi:membrane peptidoglycan carboxypeptidase